MSIPQKTTARHEAKLVLILCAFALALRLAPAVQNRFHADEALFGAWAMHIASGRDVLLASVPADKPPLAFYAMAASFVALGRVEIAARLPNLIASVMSVALTWQWAKALTHSGGRRGEGGGLLTPLVMTLSPFDVAFGGTAFLDPLTIMWGLAACVATGRGRDGWSGVFLGLALGTKVQGLLFAPLVVITANSRRLSLLLENGGGFAESRKSSALQTGPRIAFGFVAVVCIVLFWLTLRGGTPFWVQQTINYGGIRPAFASELGPRLLAWLSLWPYLFGPILGAVLAAGAIALLVDAVARRTRERQAAIDVLLVAYVIGFFALHWLLAFPVWDRYLLMLVPVGAILVERIAVRFKEIASHSQVAIMRSSRPVVLGIVALAMLPSSIQAARSAFPIGGDHSPHDGIERVAQFVRDLPIGTVVYDRWLGWEFDFYLWDAPVYRAYFETPADLARDLHVFGGSSMRYVVFPAGESTSKIERAIAAEGFTLSPVLTTTDRHGRTSFTVYQISAQ